MAYPQRRTFQQLYLAVDAHAYGPGTSASLFIPLIKTAINEAVEEVWTLIHKTNMDVFRIQVPMDIVSGQQAYNLPINWYRAKKVEIKTPNGTTYRKIDAIQEDDYRTPPQYITSQGLSDNISAYDIFKMQDDTYPAVSYTKNVIQFDVVPLSNVTGGIRLTYYYKPDPLVNDGDFIPMDVEWETPIFNLATGNFIATYLGDAERAAAYLKKANYQIGTRIASLKNMDIQESEFLETGRG